jgi:uncharacterized RDD family membrane protein YckC
MTEQTRGSDFPDHAVVVADGVHLELPIAGPALRMFANAIDLSIAIFLMIMLAVMLTMLLPLGPRIESALAPLIKNGLKPAANTNHPINPAAGLLIAIFVIAQFVVESGYFIFWEIVTNGRSPGKALIGLRVVCRNGLAINLRSSVLRNLMRIADILPANYVVGLLSMLISEGGERLGDHVAGTLVLRLDRPEMADGLQTLDESSELPLTRQQLARIGPRELQLVRGTLRRLPHLPRNRGDELLAEVTHSICLRIGIAEVPATGQIAFLRRIASSAERYTREGQR